jgi:hypothetical protein
MRPRILLCAIYAISHDYVEQIANDQYAEGHHAEEGQHRAQGGAFAKQGLDDRDDSGRNLSMDWRICCIVSPVRLAGSRILVLAGRSVGRFNARSSASGLTPVICSISARLLCPS